VRVAQRRRGARGAANSALSIDPQAGRAAALLAELDASNPDADPNVLQAWRSLAVSRR